MRYILSATLLVSLVSISLCAASEEIEEVDVVETVEVIQTSQSGKRSEEEDFTLGKIAGRLHPATVHIPLGLLLALLVVEIAAVSNREPSRSGVYLTAIALLAFVAAAVTGFSRANELKDIGVLDPDTYLHRNLMLGAFTVMAAGAAVRLTGLWNYGSKKRVLFIVLVAAALVLTLFGSHMGGKLVFGDDFLPF